LGAEYLHWPPSAIQLGPLLLMCVVQLILANYTVVSTRGPQRAWQSLGYWDQAATLACVLLTVQLWVWTVHAPQRLLLARQVQTPEVLRQRVLSLTRAETSGHLLSLAAICGTQLARASFYDFTPLGIGGALMLGILVLAVAAGSRAICLHLVELHFNSEGDPSTRLVFHRSHRRLQLIFGMQLLCWVCQNAIILDKRSPNIFKLAAPWSLAKTWDTRDQICAGVNATYLAARCPHVDWAGSVSATQVLLWDLSETHCDDGDTSYSPYRSRLDACFALRLLDVVGAKTIALFMLSGNLAHHGIVMSSHDTRAARTKWLPCLALTKQLANLVQFVCVCIYLAVLLFSDRGSFLTDLVWNFTVIIANFAVILLRIALHTARLLGEATFGWTFSHASPGQQHFDVFLSHHWGADARTISHMST
jgi:hypothetical protein